MTEKTPPTREEQSAMRARCDAATDDWTALHYLEDGIPGVYDGYGNNVAIGSKENLDFIAHARTDLPRILDYAAGLEAEAKCLDSTAHAYKKDRDKTLAHLAELEVEKSELEERASELWETVKMLNRIITPDVEETEGA